MNPDQIKALTEWEKTITAKAAKLPRPTCEYAGLSYTVEGNHFICRQTRQINASSPVYFWELAASDGTTGLGIIWPAEFWDAHPSVPSVESVPTPPAPPDLSTLFPFDYLAGGYFRAQGHPVGQPAPMLRGMNAIRYLHAVMTGADPKPFLCSEKDGEL